MSDNNLDIRARLTGEDRLSPTVVKLLAKIKSLEEQMAKFGKQAKNAITDIPMEGYVKQINATSKAINGLTRKHLDWAKANGVAGDQAQMSWGKLTNEIIRLQKEHEKWTNSTTRGSKTRAKAAQDELNQQYKNAVAFKYLYNKVGEQRLDIARRTTEQIGNLEAAHLRNQERRHALHLGNIARMRRDAMNSMRSLGNIGNRAGPYAAAAAAATGYAGVSAFRTRMRVDTAETNLKMFGGMSQDEVREMRRSYGNRAAIRYGMSPDKMIDAYTEVIKAGVPKEKAQAVTDTILKSSTGLDLDVKETTRFATRVATLTQNMKTLDPAKLKSILNAVTIAGAETAADPNEIIAANRRASGVFATSKFTPEDLSAFTGAGVSVGLPSSKTGTFLGFIVNELVGAKNARGQRGKDLSQASNLLGLGGRANLSAQMAANPADTLMKIFDKVGGMNEQQQNKVLNLLGMREWRDELAAFVEARENLADVLAKIRDPKNAKLGDEINDKRLKSLAGRWKSLVAAMSLVWESVGAGLEKAFGQISDFFTDYLGRLDTSKITSTVEAFTDGLVQGLGFDSWTSMLKAAFGNPEDVKGWASQIGGFTKGFMSAMKEMWDVGSAIWTGMMKAFGVDAADPESIGKFTGRVVEFGVALKAIGTFAETLSSIVTFVKGLAAAVAMFSGVPGWAALTAFIAAKNQDAGIPEYNIKRPGESVTQWRERQRATKELRRYKTPSGADPLFQPSSYTGPTDFSSRRRSSDIADNLQKFTGKIERAAFISNGSGGGFQTAMMGGGGSGLGLSGSGGGGGGGGVIGGVPSLMTNMPGTALPSFGLGRNGIIKRDAVPSFGDRGLNSPGADMSVGQGLSGNAFLQARRAKFAEEIKNDPSLALHLAAMQQTEGASKGGTIESLMNRADMQGKSLRQMLGYSADGRINPKSFYGPIRRGELGPAIERLRRNPKEFAKYDAFTQKAIAGSHAIGGYTDQGLPTDPNGSRRTGIPGFKISPKDGNEFTDWVGPGSSYGRGRQGAINFRHFYENGISGSSDSPIGAVPTPAQTIQNVPSPRSIAPNSDAGSGGSRGNVAIHINGSSHDPEALATLVQRRVDESMNWRTHDTASEYT